MLIAVVRGLQTLLFMSEMLIATKEPIICKFFLTDVAFQCFVVDIDCCVVG